MLCYKEGGGGGRGGAGEGEEKKKVFVWVHYWLKQASLYWTSVTLYFHFQEGTMMVITEEPCRS